MQHLELKRATPSPAYVARNMLLALACFLFVLTASALADEEPVWTRGEVRSVDLEQGKVTVRHEEISNLDMPPMTMVFHVQDPAMLEGLEEGSVREFHFVNENGRMMIAHVREVE